MCLSRKTLEYVIWGTPGQGLGTGVNTDNLLNKQFTVLTFLKPASLSKQLVIHEAHVHGDV